MDKLTLDSVVIRNDEVLHTLLNQETVLFDYDAGSYFGLNSVASAIWTITEAETTVANLCSQLQGQFDVSPDQCEKEVIDFLNDLLQKKLLRLA